MKNINRAWVIAIISLGLLSGCATVGNDKLKDETKQSIAAKITNGKTTMSEVKAMLGTPMNTNYTDGGLEIWTYEITHMSADATSYIPVVSMFAATASGTKKELVILFDENETVKKYKMNESAIKQRTGLFNQ